VEDREMISSLRLVVLFGCATALAYADNWTGVLVDAGCYASQQRNVSQDAVASGMDLDIVVRSCAPNHKSKSFVVVMDDGQVLTLNSEGNDKAAEILRSNAYKHPMRVAVTGTTGKKVLAVVSMSPAQ
jgi:hypothetical protein